MSAIRLNNGLYIPQDVLRWIIQRQLITIPLAKPNFPGDAVLIQYNII